MPIRPGAARTWALLTGLVAAVSGAATIDNPFKTSICRALGEHVPRAVDVVCQWADRPVTEQEASAFLDRYFGAASGSTPAAALRLMRPREGFDQDAFLERWSHSAWAEVVGRPVEEPAFNTYSFTLRNYAVFERKGPTWSGEIELRSVRYRLERTDDGVRLHSVGGDNNGPVQPFAFPRLTLGVAADTYRLPDTRAALQLVIGRSGAGPDVQLTGLCRTGPPDRTWVRMNQGWLEAQRLRDPASADALPECESRWLTDIEEELTRPDYARR